MVSRIAVIIGSLRQESYSRRVATTLIELAPRSLSLQTLEIGDLSLYNEDLESNPPNEWIHLRSQINSLNGVIFVTPEYNRSVPGLLKNAIDIASRPYGKSAWEGKPAGIVSVSPGPLGAFGANHHLRQSLVFLNMPTLQQPEVYLGNIAQLLDESGKLTNESTRDFLRQFLEAFASWVAKVRSETATSAAA